MHGGWHILSRLIRKSMIPRLNFFSVRKQVIWKERKWAENPGNSIIRVARDRPVAAEAFSKTAAVRPFLLGGTDHEKPPPLKGPTKKVFVYYIDFHSLNRKKFWNTKIDDSSTKKFSWKFWLCRKYQRDAGVVTEIKMDFRSVRPKTYHIYFVKYEFEKLGTSS